MFHIPPSFQYSPAAVSGARGQDEEEKRKANA
jgi:hypothetical protein